MVGVEALVLVIVGAQAMVAGMLQVFPLCTHYKFAHVDSLKALELLYSDNVASLSSGTLSPFLVG